MSRVRAIMVAGVVPVLLLLVGSWRATGGEVEARAETRRSRPITSIARAPTPPSPDVGFGEMLAAVQQRSHDLDSRERGLAEREAALAALARTLDGTITRLEGGAAPSLSQSSCRLEGGVTRIYERMRPEQAAPILDRMDDETLRVVFAQMDPEKVGAIVAEMSRERAVAFTRVLAHEQAVGGDPAYGAP